jgi:hypothetical protein
MKHHFALTLLLCIAAAAPAAAEDVSLSFVVTAPGDTVSIGGTFGATCSVSGLDTPDSRSYVIAYYCRSEDVPDLRAPVASWIVVPGK